MLNDADFVDGYLEEVDYCLRAAEAGFRNVCACDIYVGHVGGTSFGDRRRDLVMRNIATLQKAFPTIKTETHRFVQDDPLTKARDALQIELLRGRCFEGNRRSLWIESSLEANRLELDSDGGEMIVLAVNGKAPTKIRLHAQELRLPANWRSPFLPTIPLVHCSHSSPHFRSLRSRSIPGICPSGLPSCLRHCAFPTGFISWMSAG